MGSGYNRYCSMHKSYAREMVTQKEQEYNLLLLKHFDLYLQHVNMYCDIETLQEQQGYRYNEHTNEIKHLFTPKMIDVLESICSGDLETLKKLNKEEKVYVGCHKDINVRLAIKYNQIEIINYLIETKQVNRDMDRSVGELGNIELFNNLKKYGYFNEPNSTNSELANFYIYMHYLTIDGIYKYANEYGNKTLAEYIKINHM